jgi:hypothetical protein
MIPRHTILVLGLGILRIPKLYTIKDLAIERKHVRPPHEKSEERSKKV